MALAAISHWYVEKLSIFYLLLIALVLGSMGKQLKFLFLVTLTTLVVLTGSILQVGEPLMAAQVPHANEIANQLYAQYPDIPKAKQADSTLLSRFVDYHLDAKARPAQYHLDWELSMADYLNASYGDRNGPSTVANADKRAMQALSRQQRHALVHTLEQLFSR
ncbi:MAG: hypothetical protein AAGI45_00910 [Cyanobacteria bacterium P01_H01_bin.26]